jgi:Tfp pilus assembly protein PilN
MRPVNLIPPEQRHGQQAPLRSGPLAYIVVGALVLALAAVSALVLTNNQIADRKSDVARLKQEDVAASVRALRLAAYTQFRTLREQRVATVQSLADSRFDWERVMRELALILPSDAWLTDLSAGASSTAGGGDSGSGLGGSVSGPSLQLSGCAKGQEGVAGFVTALKDIDGVTRVGLESSSLSGEEGGGEASSDSGGGCVGDSVASFSITVAFDAAPVPSLSTEEAAPVTPAAETTSTEGAEEG